MNETTSENKPDSAKAPLTKWSALYDAADRIRALEPWEHFCEVDIAEVYLKDAEEPYYCSFTGMFEEEKSVSVYFGHKGLVSLSGFINSTDMPEYVALGKRNCLECLWCSRSDLRKADLDTIKGTGHKYRGADAWPLFRNYEAGYEPWFISEAEVEIITEVLTELANAVKETTDCGELEFLKEGDRIMRRFNTENGCWENEILAPIEKIEAVTDGCVITDELLIRRLKNKPINENTLEFDMIYLPVPLRGKDKNQRPFFPKLCLICDTENMKMENQYFVDRFEDPRDIALGMIVGYIEEKGRPATIYVRDAEMLGIIGHLCKCIDVEVFFTPALHMLDYFVQDIILTMRQ